MKVKIAFFLFLAIFGFWRVAIAINKNKDYSKTEDYCLTTNNIGSFSYWWQNFIRIKKEWFFSSFDKVNQKILNNNCRLLELRKLQEQNQEGFLNVLSDFYSDYYQSFYKINFTPNFYQELNKNGKKTALVLNLILEQIKFNQKNHLNDPYFYNLEENNLIALANLINNLERDNLAFVEDFFKSRDDLFFDIILLEEIKPLLKDKFFVVNLKNELLNNFEKQIKDLSLNKNFEEKQEVFNNYFLTEDFNNLNNLLLIEEIYNKDYLNLNLEDWKILLLVKDNFLQKFSLNKTKLSWLKIEKFFSDLNLDKIKIYQGIVFYLPIEFQEKLLSKINDYNTNLKEKINQGEKTEDILSQYNFLLETEEFVFLDNLSRTEVNEELVKKIEQFKLDYIVYFNQKLKNVANLEVNQQKKELFKMISCQAYDLSKLLVWSENNGFLKKLVEWQKSFLAFRVLNTPSIEVLKNLEREIYQDDYVFKQMAIEINFMARKIKNRKLVLDEETEKVLKWVEDFDKGK